MYLGVSGKHNLYVQPQMKIPLIASALILFLLAGVKVFGPERVQRVRKVKPTALPSQRPAHKPGKSAARKRRKAAALHKKPTYAAQAHRRQGSYVQPSQNNHHVSDSCDHHDGHDHGTKVAWLLLLPVFVVAVVSPPALGTASVSGTTNLQRMALTYRPLPETKTATALKLAEYVGRSLEPFSPSVKGRLIELVGFGVPPKSGGGFMLIRFSIACCAADAMASQIRILGELPRVPALGSRDLVWLKVVGTHKDVEPGLPVFQPQSITEIEAPREPYE